MLPAALQQLGTMHTSALRYAGRRPVATNDPLRTPGSAIPVKGGSTRCNADSLRRPAAVVRLVTADVVSDRLGAGT